MNEPAESSLPKFDDPPVIETAIGVEFTGLSNWGVPYFGLFWNLIRDQYVKWEVKPPLTTNLETFNAPPEQPSPQIELVNAPEVRCWYISEDNRSLVQLQKDRLVFNWRQVDPKDKYPHYEKFIKPTFAKVWGEFRDFVRKENLGEITLSQCEVTYINHMLMGEGWDSFDQINNIFPIISKNADTEFLPAPEIVTFNSSYRLPDHSGRLRVDIKPVIRKIDGSQAFQQTMTARVKTPESDDQTLLECLDLGREWVVRGFADITSKEMHKLWERRS